MERRSRSPFEWIYVRVNGARGARKKHEKWMRLWTGGGDYMQRDDPIVTVSAVQQ